MGTLTRTESARSGQRQHGPWAYLTTERLSKSQVTFFASDSKWGIIQLMSYSGSVLLLSKERNEPLGLRNAPARTSHSSLPTGMYPEPLTPPLAKYEEEKKMTKDGQIILEPQPDDSHNDPLNWPAWRRDCALLSLGLYCMVGGGITPIIAAGFTDVADGELDVSMNSCSSAAG
jgi:hypothetical protein